MKFSILLMGLATLAVACVSTETAAPLPILGNHQIDENGDTTYHRIPPFAFTNQDSQQVTSADFTDKIYIADFFFVSCPTICPKVTAQMLRIHDKYRDNDRLRFLSYTIDPKRDTVARLRKYATGLGVQAPKWQFVTGEKDVIYELAEDYLSIAREDPNAPGGFDHSGWLILVDEQGRIRSFANGTEAEAVDELMADIDWLLDHPGVE